jgi:hypothetical protein
MLIGRGFLAVGLMPTKTRLWCAIWIERRVEQVEPEVGEHERGFPLR